MKRGYKKGSAREMQNMNLNMGYGLNSFITNYIPNNRQKKYLITLIILLAIFLNQSKAILGLNLSFSDIICLIILILLLIHKRLFIPFAPLMFLLLLLLITLFTSVFYVPIKFNYYPNSYNLLVNYLKLFAIFVFFIIGFNINKLNLMDLVIKWYANFAVLISLIGLILIFIDFELLKNAMFYGNVRYIGLMNDPNYFSIIQVSAIGYYIRQKKINKIIKYTATLLLILSVLLSGSKTGLLTLLCYFLLLLIEYIWKWKNNYLLFMYFIMFGLLPVLIIILFSLILDINMFNKIIQLLETSIPSFNRLKPLLTGDLYQAISGGGSSRNLVWITALKIIELSPIFGIGIGTYNGISYKISGSRQVAHNTFLQLFAEWGIPLATFFFITVIFMISKITILKRKKIQDLILRDILIIFLIGSLGISLNNARMFWLFLGALMFNLQYNGHVRINTDSETSIV